MNNSFLIKTVKWGFLLWLVGYVLGIVLFAVLPPAALGWVIMPIGIAITLWVLFRKFKEPMSIGQWATLGLIWTAIAIICDYLFLVLAFAPVGGYYKLDVYLYYLLTFALPVLVGSRRQQNPAV